MLLEFMPALEQVTVEGGRSKALTDTLVLMVLRWIHFIFGILWIGHLYYFNFVQAHAEKALDAATKRVVVPNFRGRALWWFRWGAMITFLSGLTYIVYEEVIANGTNFLGGWTREAKNQWILFGMLLGTIMWFNVWFVIWPRQKKILQAIATGAKPEGMDAWIAKAALFSKLNAYLSFPMLFAMGARHHFVLAGLKPGMQTGIAMLVVFVVGFMAAVHVLKHAGPKVGTEFAKLASNEPAA